MENFFLYALSSFLLIFSEAEMLNEDWDARDGTRAPDMTIPILLRNQVPEGFETDDKLDVSLRPDGVSSRHFNTKSYIRARGRSLHNVRLMESA